MLRFIHISDTHINPDRDYNKEYARYTPNVGVEAMIQAINDLPYVPDFILHTGDVAYDPFPEVYDNVKALMALLPAPIHYLAGNHDDSAAIQKVLMQRDTIEDYLYYEFEAQGVQIVCLDSNGPHDPEQPSGFVTQAQLDWLDDICTADDERPLVIATHHNVLPTQSTWVDDWMRTENADDLHAIIRQARDRLCGVFYGHIHQNIQQIKDGVLYVSAGSSWGHLISYPSDQDTHYSADFVTQPSFNLVTIADGVTTVRRHTYSVDVD